MGAIPEQVTLLIHGGCHGAWCWTHVVDGLGSHGIEARAFDLPGCGQDTTPRATVNLAAQVACVIAQVDAIPNAPVRLVAHSIGGWLLPPVTAARPERVTELVFLAASTLRRGECGIDITPPERRQGYFDLAASSGENSLMIPFEGAWDRFFNHLPEHEARAAYAQLTPQAFEPYLGPALVGIEDVDIPRRYIATDDDKTYPDEFTLAFAAKAGVEREVIAGDHCVMLSNPRGVLDALSQ